MTHLRAAAQRRSMREQFGDVWMTACRSAIRFFTSAPRQLVPFDRAVVHGGKMMAAMILCFL